MNNTNATKETLQHSEQKQVLPYKKSPPFSHRFDADNANSLEAVSDKIGVIGYRTRGLLTLVLDCLLDRCSHEDSHIVATVEVAIDEIKDMEEIKYMLDRALMDMPPQFKTNSTEVIGGSHQ